MLKIQHVQYVGEEANGIALGFAVHAMETIKALVRYGVVLDEKAEIALHQCPGHAVKKVVGKINVLYTAFESPHLPEIYIEPAKGMDLIVCVSEFSAKAYRRALPGKLVKVCPLGVDVNTFSYVKRKTGNPFIYLWVGAPNYRKGWDLIRTVWRNHFQFRSDCLLVIKTTGRGLLERSDNVIVDSRKLDREELAKIYHWAHCFVFPSYAEGFGLPLAEAMATGLPSVFVPWSGVTEFANKKNAYPVRYKLVGVDYGGATVGAEADIGSLAEAMLNIKNDYQYYTNHIGKNAARDIESKFTWTETGNRMKKILEDYLSHGPNR